MNRIKLILVALPLLFAAGSFSHTSSQDASEVIRKVSLAIQNGSHAELSKFFNLTVELEILAEENFYSKAQAEILLKNFFEKHKPVKFTVSHQGIKETSCFAIGMLTAKSSSMRISVFLRLEQGQWLIHQLRIELVEDGANR